MIAATHRNLFVSLALVLAAPLAASQALAKPGESQARPGQARHR